MRSIHSLLALVIAAAAVMAPPARAQRVADLAPGVALHAPSARTEVAPVLLAPARTIPPALRPTTADARDAAAGRPISVAGHAAIGAGAGALIGGLAFLAMYAIDDDCRSADSMCGLAIPAMVGGGAVTGGIVGGVVGLIRNR